MGSGRDVSQGFAPLTANHTDGRTQTTGPHATAFWEVTLRIEWKKSGRAREGTREWVSISTGECGAELCIMQANGRRNTYFTEGKEGARGAHTHTHTARLMHVSAALCLAWKLSKWTAFPMKQLIPIIISIITPAEACESAGMGPHTQKKCLRISTVKQKQHYSHGAKSAWREREEKESSCTATWLVWGVVISQGQWYA